MRSLTTLLAVLIFTATGFSEDKSSCPAEKAAKAGFEAYRSFHLVLAPLWHNA